MIETLRKLCADLWNPIGVPMRVFNGRPGGDQPWFLPCDEYDNYLRHAWSLVTSGATEEELIKYLKQVEDEYIMLTSPHGDKAAFANALFHLAKLH